MASYFSNSKTAMDLSRLRDQAIGANIDVEAVTVNTRALIDKVLARYSGEWTTLRELIQNAADAGAQKVVIRFETLPNTQIPLPNSDESSLLNHTIAHHTLYRLVVSNDGTHFADTDWARLKRIAEGNPDETKIGAFGVGFYSVFADCEEPFVVSGDKTMAFLWKGNSLYTKAANLPEEQPKQDTCFVLNYRSTTSPIPNLMSICQFLATSLTFVGLQSIELWLDQWNIIKLQKKSAPEIVVSIPSGINTTTAGGVMTIGGITHQSTQIDGTWMNIIGRPVYQEDATEPLKEEENPVMAIRSFFSKITQSSSKRAKIEKAAATERQIQGNFHETSQGAIFLRISTVKVLPRVTSSFAAELTRATKKPPPKQTKIAILTASYDETAASKSNSSGLTADVAESLFSSVLPSKNGRIFIGFPTAQTTGMLCHISAPSIIPTVERESIDLNARYVRDWNAELLRVAGIACRLSYMGTFEDLSRKVSTPKQVQDAIPEATHIFKQYFSTESTPSYNVGRLIEEGFWDCSKTNTIAVLSTKGVLGSDKVRVVSESLGFLEEVPVIPPELAKKGEDFVRRLYERKLIHDLTVTDVKKELERRSLSGEHITEFLTWLGQQAEPGRLDANTIDTLLKSAVAVLPNKEDSSKDEIIIFSQVKNFVTGKMVPPLMPVPRTTVPFEISKTFKAETLIAFGWHELQILDWVMFLLNRDNNLPKDQQMEVDALFSTNVLMTVSKHWDSQSNASKQKLTELFTNRCVIPTKLGMKKAPDAYFASVTLFDDLPNVVSELKVKDKALAAWGVRKTIEMSLVFERLMSAPKGQPQWRFIDLIRYLVSIQSDIPSKDIDRLKQAPICPIEVAGKLPGQMSQAPKLVSISQVYEPTESMRMLEFPVLYWPDTYNPNSSEAKMLKRLGIKSYPAGKDVIARIWRAGQTKDINKFSTALNYYINYYEQNGYSRDPKAEIQSLPIIQVEGKPFPNFVAPQSCYANPQAAVLGYPIMQQSMALHGDKFGVKKDPDIQSCTNSIIGNPPVTEADAIKVFEYMASRLNEIGSLLADQLGSAQIVPIASKTVTRLGTPNMCFLGDSSEYGDIFDFVDFGQRANSFLIRVGSKMEPTTFELAKMVRDGPARILESLGDKNYLGLLRRLAENAKTLKGDKKLWHQLQTAPFLMGFKEVVQKDSKDDEDYQSIWEYSLHKPSEIVILDSFKDYSLFKDHLIVAPEEDKLEIFYASLGSQSLRSILIADERLGSTRRDQSPAIHVKKLLVERTRLFLHEYSSDKIVNDYRWLEKNLAVVVVDSITVTTRLRNLSVKAHREEKTALFSQSKPPTLYITPSPDLYEVSRVVVPRLLSRHKQTDVLALEMVLGSDLRRLRSKGYNIDRILRQEAIETRMAEEERRKQRDHEKQRDEKQREHAREQARETNQIAPPPAYIESPARDVPKMPGAFEHSPPPPPPKEPVQDVHRGHNLFDQVRNWSQSLSHMGGSSQRPPMMEPMVPQDAVENERQVEQNLANAIQSCQPHKSNMLFNPPTATTIEQAKGSYCDTTPMADLTFHAQSTNSQSLRVYLPRGLTPEAYSQTWAAKSSGIAVFAGFLVNLSSVFGTLRPDMLHVFAGTQDTKTIAFNSSGALFFNYDVFEKLHISQVTAPGSKIEPFSYWFVTMAHELAHNLVKEHSAAHSFYTESFVAHYFAGAVQMVLQMQ
jgi:hypothetical protein